MSSNRMQMLDTKLTSFPRMANRENRSVLYPSDPNERLFLARTRQRELIEEARITRHATKSVISSNPPEIERVRGLHVRLGGILIVVGRRITEDRPCPDMAA
jgi:hypothetical protein